MMKGTSLRSLIFHGLGCPNSKDFPATMVFVNMIDIIISESLLQSSKEILWYFCVFLMRATVYLSILKLFLIKF
jgi:hypothetical protein